ncbi:hypothetical protein [Paenibacillus glacialis]|uniref:Uncharacterized protein n=1 Tax=Paenibacillus glacialis TaxID=494026 RepID=A0A168NP57_9BACL|nr:hypothetical protein [Paenibacillus glacialis]OAB45987.1 hypothetical protein PGLA_00900 [Paenibacillus glacialis]
MKTSVGVWDSLFGKKVELELKNDKGNTVKRKISEKLYNQLLMEDKIEEIVNAVIFNTMNGLLSEVIYKIDEEISMESYKKFKNIDTGKIYIIEYYEEGELSSMILTKEKFEETLSEMQ